MMRPTPAGTQQQQEELPHRDRKSLPKLTVKGGDATQAIHSVERWMMLTMVSLNTWGSEAARVWENAVQEAKAQHMEYSIPTSSASWSHRPSLPTASSFGCHGGTNAS